MSKRSVLIATILIGLMTFQVYAQRPGGRRGGSWSTLDLDQAFVGYRSVRTELGLSEPQIELLIALDTDLTAQLRSGFRRRRGPDRTAQLEVSQKIFRTLLEPKQVERLAEINLQFRGLYAIDDEKFVKDISLTEEQLSAIRAARKENQNFDMSKLNDLVGLDKAKKWWTTLGKPFRFSSELQDLQRRYQERQQPGRFRLRRP